MTAIANNTATVLALDVGERRIGVARANMIARLPEPLTTVPNDEGILTVIQTLVKDNKAGQLVVGRPRNQQGEETNQTRAVEAFVAKLEAVLDIPIAWQDESVTSVKAEAELQQRGGVTSKGDIDALAATYILDDYLSEQQ